MPEPVEEKLPEGDALFFTGFFQAGEGIPTSSFVFRSGAAADFSFNDVFPNVTFAEIVVEWDIRSFQYKKQFFFVERQAFERLIKGGEGGFGPAQFIEMGLDCLFQVRILILLVEFQVRVDLPDLGMDPVELFGVGFVERKYARKDPVGMDPHRACRRTLNCPASSLMMTRSGGKP